jgi:DNA polymerase III sliding clamp (beta) subunit (PCNA family)
MSTLEDKVTAVNYVEGEGALLLELLEGVSTHADKDKGRPTINAVHIESEGGLFKAKATDRYRLIEGSVQTLDGRLDASLISLEDTKRVIALVKGNKVSRVTFNRIGDLITVSVSGSSITVQILDANYPASFNDLLNKSEREQLGEIAFNPAFFADYGKIAGKGNAVRVEFTGKGKPMIIHLPITKVEWRALLMPMRYVD